VRVVALSKDTIEEAATHKARDELSFTLLADPKLEVIRQYRVEHHKALGFETSKRIVGGIPLASTPSFKTMAIPTWLVDENGVIQWIDQTDDYRLRSDNTRVLGAGRSAFG
jgi:alkyl hydroperoxide reductase subunit AhpC